MSYGLVHLASIILFLLIGIAAPILSSFYVYDSPYRSKANKRAWVVAIFLLWPVGAILYALGQVRRPWYRLYIIATTAITVPLLITQLPHYYEEITNDFPNIAMVSQLQDQLNTPDLTVALGEANTDQLKISLNELWLEIRNNKNDRIISAALVFRLEDLFTSNRLHNIEEYERWMRLYRNRFAIREEELKTLLND